MAKFRYTMQNILDIKYKMENQAKNTYAARQAKLNEEQAKLEAMFMRKKQLEDDYRTMASGSLNVRSLLDSRRAIDFVRDQIKAQVIEVRVAEKNVEAARIRLNEAMQERKTHEKLKERQFETFLQELAEQEKKEIDELVSYKYNDRPQD